MLQDDNGKPIYIQIAEWLETEILNGHLKVDDKVFSQYQLADMFTINPATAAKGLNRLAENNILYKKRGLGMFVTEGAEEKVRHKRKEETLTRLVENVVKEAAYLEVEEDELIAMITSAVRQSKEEKK